MWEYTPKIAKIGIFWYKFAQKGYSALSDFYNTLPGEGAPGLHLMPNFTAIALKMWPYGLKNRQKL